MIVKHFPFLWLTLVCYSLFITYVSLMSGHGEGDFTELKQYKIPHLDKLLHVAAYWLYALLALLASRDIHRRWLVGWMLLLLILHGTVLEYLQITLAVGREASLPDIVANTTGIVLGYVTMLIYQHFQAHQHG
ncbi:VanZ family protein [Photobacterium alginatilyticum]|uniref:VanZ family protein n=1 Tax=Photobacterium alginatilyticum TaxID=1775171 RepID=UPI004067C060